MIGPSKESHYDIARKYFTVVKKPSHLKSSVQLFLFGWEATGHSGEQSLSRCQVAFLSRRSYLYFNSYRFVGTLVQYPNSRKIYLFFHGLRSYRLQIHQVYQVRREIDFLKDQFCRTTKCERHHTITIGNGSSHSKPRWCVSIPVLPNTSSEE